MPFLMSLLALLLAAGAARGQTAEVDRLEVIDFGTYKAEPGSKRKNANGLKTTVTPGVEHLETTAIIPARIGTSFGIRYKVVGDPDKAEVTLRKVISFPPPGLQPSRGKFVPQSESKVETMIGETVADLYTLEDIFELVPGVWTVELWDGDRKLLTQSFTLERPAAPPRPDAVVTPKTSPPPKATPAPAAKTAPKPATPVKPESAPDNF
jgi:Domain of unknown function (DUF3859)